MLDVSMLLLISTAVVFLLLIGILNNMLYKPLMEYMHKRDLSITNDLDKVAQIEDEIAKLNAQADKIILDAKYKASAQREKVIAETKLLVAKKIEEHRLVLAENYAKFESSLYENRVELMKSLTLQVPVFKSQIAAKYSTL